VGSADGFCELKDRERKDSEQTGSVLLAVLVFCCRNSRNVESCS
jgi:hypothetical protein